MFTDRQQEILDFIREQQTSRGITPSRAEIHIGIGQEAQRISYVSESGTR